MSRKVKTFASEKARLLKITQKLMSFWEDESQKPALDGLIRALDAFVGIVNVLEALAVSKPEKDLIKQIRCFFVPEEELAVLLILFLDHPMGEPEDKKLKKTIEKFTSPNVVKQREEELKMDVKKIEAILLQD